MCVDYAHQHTPVTMPIPRCSVAPRYQKCTEMEVAQAAELGEDELEVRCYRLSLKMLV